jgi:hypothetical protein
MSNILQETIESLNDAWNEFSYESIKVSLLTKFGSIEVEYTKTADEREIKELKDQAKKHGKVFEKLQEEINEKLKERAQIDQIQFNDIEYNGGLVSYKNPNQSFYFYNIKNSNNGLKIILSLPKTIHVSSWNKK